MLAGWISTRSVNLRCRSVQNTLPQGGFRRKPPRRRVDFDKWTHKVKPHNPWPCARPFQRPFAHPPGNAIFRWLVDVSCCSLFRRVVFHSGFELWALSFELRASSVKVQSSRLKLRAASCTLWPPSQALHRKLFQNFYFYDLLEKGASKVVKWDIAIFNT